MEFFTLYNSKIEVSETCFFDIVAAQVCEACFRSWVRVSHPIRVFGVRRWGRSVSPWTSTQPAEAASHRVQVNIEFYGAHIFDFVATQNDLPSYVKHVLGRVYMFFTLFGGWVLKVDSLPGAGMQIRIAPFGGGGGGGLGGGGGAWGAWQTMDRPWMSMV